MRRPLMQCLAPFEPREAGPRGAAATRLSWFVIAVAVSVGLGLLLIMNWREVIATLHRHTVLQAELAICAGTLAGLLLSRMEVNPITQRRIAALDQLYERAASAPARVEPGYTHYLPCVVLLTNDPSANVVAEVRARSEGTLLKTAAGAVLYFGPKGVLLSSPHDHPDPSGIAGVVESIPASTRSRQRTWLRARPVPPRLATTDLGTVREVTAVSVALPQGQLARVARMQPKNAMLLRWPRGQALIAVPSIGDTLPRLHRCLDELRWAADAARPRK